ncbi:MAG: hypothetical protein ACK4TK_07595 [Thiobacillaceae bacterium]
MAGLIARLFGSHAHHAGDAGIETALARAVARVEPRLEQAGDFPRRYRRSVAHALEYVRQLAQAIPGPVEMAPELYARDPFIHVLFSGPDEMQQALCMSHAMHEYTRRPGGPGTDAYALMGMRRREKTAFGMELQGELLRREVAQRVVIFTDHTLSGPAPTEAEARQLLMWNLFDSLLGRVSERIQARRQARQALEQERDYLRADLRLAPPERRSALQQRLEKVLAELAAASATLDLRRLAQDFDEVLLNPEQHLRLERVKLNVDGMGVLRPNSAPAAHELGFTDLHGRDRRRWTVVMVHCHPRPELLAMDERLHQASRWLQL